MNPLVSIVVTAYNMEKYIEDSILSIIKQNYKNWEIVFVDDCSTDKTIDKFKEVVIKNNIIDKVKMFKHITNYGYGAALYHSIDNSNGDIIAIVDSDDVLIENNALEIMVAAHIRYPEASLIYSNYCECKEDLKQYKKIECTTLKEGQTVLGRFKNGVYHGTNVTISHLKTFKKSYYNKTDGVNPFLKKAVDRDVVLKLEEVGKLIHIPQYLYGHRIHSTSISSSFKSKTNEYKKEVYKMKDKMYNDAMVRRGLAHAFS